METKEVIAMLTWLNRVDARVQLNESAVELWDYTLQPITAQEAKAALLEHYRTNESVAATPAAIRKRALTLRSVAEASTRAIEAPVSERSDSAAYKRIRRWVREEFQEEFEQGRHLGAVQRGQVLDA